MGKLSRYLKIVGIISIIDAVIGLIYFSAYCIETKPSFWVFIIGFTTILLIAPSIGITMYVVGCLIEDEQEIGGIFKNTKKTTLELFSYKEISSVRRCNVKAINVVIPSVYRRKHVAEIENGAFEGCHALCNVQIPDSVTLIGYNAFSGCGSLRCVIIGNGITKISEGAFSGCSSLETIYYTGTKKQWNNISIGSNNEYLTNANIVYNYEG